MGPLTGLKVIEFAGIGPGPFCCMLLADLGADVLRVDRFTSAEIVPGLDPGKDIIGRGRRSVAVDLKNAEGVALTLDLIERADVLVEGFRPGVMERLGLGPDVALIRNPRLIYGRMTGWGQFGPLAHAAGHDINYIALTGALHAMGRAGEKPLPPLNLVGDLGGGALYLAFGLLAAFIEMQQSGSGQVVDAAITDGSASLMTAIYGMKAQNRWLDRRGSNLLDTGAPWYDSFECADGKFIAIGAIERKFYAELLSKLGIAGEEGLPEQFDMNRWPELRGRLAARFREKTRDAWSELLEGSDACFAPVLSMEDAPQHPHNVSRGTFIEIDGVIQPGPVPRFSRTPGAVRYGSVTSGQGGTAALAEWGIDKAVVTSMLESGSMRIG